MSKVMTCGSCGWCKQQDNLKGSLLTFYRCHSPQYTHGGFDEKDLPRVEPDDECLVGMTEQEARMFGVYEGGDE